MRTVHCPKCDADVSDTYESDDWSVGIVGGWYCDACDLGIAEHEIGYEHYDDDVPIEPVQRDLSKPLGTPLSELAGRPDGTMDGQARYENFVRIAKSWGYE